MKRIISLVLLVCIAFSLTDCKKEEYKTRSRTLDGEYFDTMTVISTYADESNENIEKYVKIANEVLGYYHKLFDIYNSYEGVNNVKTVNDNAGVKPVKVDTELIDFLEYCKELYTITNGKTNVMMGSVLKIWHECREEAEKNFGYLDPDYLPSDEELSEAAKHISINSLTIDREASTVYITDENASLDVGAVAKGYTVDVLAERIKKTGASSVVLNVGGNIRTIGVKPDGSKWESGIRNPDLSSDETLKCRIRIGESSIVTSGDYERFFTTGFEDYHHIIDPDTLMPARYFSSVSVITESSALGDALSTALFCMSYEEGKALIESIGGIEVIWIDTEYNLMHTDGIEISDIKE